VPSRPRKRDQQKFQAELRVDKYPAWNDFFKESDYEELVGLCFASATTSELLRHHLPVVIGRYLRARKSEPASALADRRKKLEQINNQAKKLRKMLLNLDGTAYHDLMSVAGRYTGNSTSVDPLNPDKWLSVVITEIRDVGVCAGAANMDLKRQARRGGRPKHTAERLLIWDLAVLYRYCSKKRPGYRGYFPKFAMRVFELVDPSLNNSGLDHVIKEIIQDFKKNHPK